MSAIHCGSKLGHDGGSADTEHPACTGKCRFPARGVCRSLSCIPCLLLGRPGIQAPEEVTVLVIPPPRILLRVNGCSPAA